MLFYKISINFFEQSKYMFPVANDTQVITRPTI